MLEALKTAELTTEKIHKYINNAKLFFNDLDELEQQLLSAYSTSLDSIYLLQNCIDRIPTICQYEKLEVPATLKMEFCDSYYHYILKYRLPHRLKYRREDSAKEISSLRDRSIIYNGYYNGVREFLNTNSIQMYEEKIFLVFINFYTSENEFYDEDNLDVKPFIDAAIKQVLVPDDNNKYISYAVCSKKGDYPHTEVYAGKKENVLSFLV